MKKILPLLTIIVFASPFVKGQSLTIREPEFIGNIAFFGDSTGNGLLLTYQRGEVKMDRGINKRSGYYFIEGCCSNTEIAKRKDLKFVAKFSDNTSDPFSMIAVNQLFKEGKTRVIGRFTKEQSTEARINFNCKKFGVSSYLIEIPAIDTGEFAIAIKEYYYSFRIK